MRQWRIIANNAAGERFRLFTIGIACDKYNDRFVKVLFPDLRDVAILHFNKPAGVDKADLAKGNFIPHSIGNSKGLEYSFHFGVKEAASHFKDPSVQAYIQVEHRPEPLAECTELMSVDLYDFAFNKVFTKQPSDEDVVIDHPLTVATRFRLVCLPNEINYNLKFDNASNLLLIGHYQIDTREFGIRFLLLEEQLLDIPLGARGIVVYKQDINYVDKTHTVHTKESFEVLGSDMFNYILHEHHTTIEAAKPSIWYW